MTSSHRTPFPAIVVGGKDITRALYGRRTHLVYIRDHLFSVNDIHYIKRSISPGLTLFGVQLAPIRNVSELRVGGKFLRLWANGNLIEKVRMKIVRIDRQNASDPTIYYRAIYPNHYLGCEGCYRYVRFFDIDSADVQNAGDVPFYLHYRTVKPERRPPMPVIIVYGIPKETEERELAVFAEALRDATALIPELALRSKDVSVFFPSDCLSAGLGDEIIICVEGFLHNPRRAVKQVLAHDLGCIAAFRFPFAYVECFVRNFCVEQDALFTRTPA